VGVVDLLTNNFATLVAKSSMNFGLQIYKLFHFYYNNNKKKAAQSPQKELQPKM